MSTDSLNVTPATVDTEAFAASVVAARVPVGIEAGSQSVLAYDVSGIPGASRLPRALVTLLENVVRRAQTDEDAVRQARGVVKAGLAGEQGGEVEFMPARVLFQDFTGVPVFVDFAAMRDAIVELGGDPERVNPHIPCTLIVDHSVIADVAGQPDACSRNQDLEASRNHERFSFLKWSGSSFDNVRIVAPGVGICHQLNIERFCDVVTTDALATADRPVACFDTLVGTDSHTTTANGLGVLGWGVGGIEAEAAALGQPISMLVPPVVELRLGGALQDGVSGMDLALTVAKLLRETGVVGSFVEVTGPGVASLTATQRSCVANMTPEYGATTTLFPVDQVTLDYLRLTGRDPEKIELVREYLGRQGTFGETDGRVYARTIELDLSTVEPCLAGPSRPHNQVSIADLKDRFEACARENGRDLDETFVISCADGEHALRHGALAIAAITSCTTATDPAMMVAAGLLAKKAVMRGLRPKPWVKTILAPGSHAVARLLDEAELSEPLRQLGFYTCGFGCMSCIGNSGEIMGQLRDRSNEMELTSVLSGNRNFDGRISPYVSQNYLCQPAYVVAYSLAGSMDVDLSQEPVGLGFDGKTVMLSEILPTDEEVAAVLDRVLTPELYASREAGTEDSAAWAAIESGSSATFPWDPDSTYVRRAPYFDIAKPQETVSINGARVLALLGDFVTTDHISPAGAIAADSPAARYLEARGVRPEDFNTYGSRRGNHEVMARGTFANVKLKNALADGRLGGLTRDFIDGEIKPIFDAAEDYRAAGVPLVVVAGKLYGSGSSRDWAGKGPLLLGVRAVIAESFERIHRSNLVQMGVLPLQFEEGESAESLGLTGEETFDISPIGLGSGLPEPSRAKVLATAPDGSVTEFTCVVRVDTPMEGRFLASGGILPYVLGEIS